ncbi:MAG: hypothetical protein WC815_09400 [Vicinamibacterales bacterium]|jgi:hypothetical protein
MTSNSRWPSPLSLIVFIAGLVAAAASGVWTYRAVGLYGGPILTGFHREWNPRTRSYQLVHETTTNAGLRIRRLLTDTLDVQQTDLSGAAVGPVVEQLTNSGTRVAFSTRNDGVIDAFATRDARLGTARIEVATKRDGRIDRWEQYAREQLIRVDLDTDGNGKADRWMTYEDGILMDTFIDANEDGQPDGPPAR